METVWDYDDERLWRRLERSASNPIRRPSSCQKALRKNGTSIDCSNKSANRKCHGGQEPNDDNDVDPDYELFLERLREDEDLYILKFGMDASRSVTHDDGTEQVSCGKSNMKAPQSSKNHVKKDNLEARRSRRVNLRSENSQIPRTGKKDEPGEANEEKDPKNVPIGRKRMRNFPRVREEVGHSSENEHNEDELDEDYVAFLSCLRNDGNIMVYVDTIGIQVRYEEGDDGERSLSSDVEILAAEDVIHFKGNQAFVTAKQSVWIDEDDECPGGISDCEFREKLIERLKMPFDVMEYEELFQKVKFRRQKELERRLKGGREITYVTNTPCKSYLDLHPELAEKINSMQGDQRRILNLLRGFFFWLHNLANAGVFQPWKDPACLKILPELRSNALV